MSRAPTSKSSIKRGATPVKARKRQTGSRKVKRVSALDKLIKALPFTQTQMQRVLTWAIVGIVAIGLIVTANLTGMTTEAHAQYAHLASKAGFEVKNVEVSGIRRVDELKVYDLVLAEKDRAMPLVDVSRIRQDLMQYGWIGEARVSRRLPDTLVVEIKERQPAAVWSHGDALALIDAEGHVLEEISSEHKPNLPMLVGPDANRKAVALADLLSAAPALKPRIAGAEWIGNRRWNLNFKTGETLALPEGRDVSAEALIKFAKMDGVNRLLGDRYIYFDFRDPTKGYLRPRPDSGLSAQVVTGEAGAAGSNGEKG
ncbi:cell division protein FtsQ/DivIB [Novosphingopyxis sp.]|uniref:cell division protein FtsQ/DivIB n=1 Tax=Novosphingopyxis sp. TaxID=2709690 RepID=UPI003B5BE547